MTRTTIRLLVALALVVAGPVLGVSVAGARDTQGARPPEITVLDAGSEPREALRLAPAAGASDNVAMTMRLDLEQSGVADVSLNAPPIRAAIAATLAGMTPSGDFQVTFSYPSFEVLKRKGTTAEQRNRIARALDAFEQLSGAFTLSGNGALVESTLDIPDDVDPNAAQLLGQIRDQFRDLTVPLPDEAVGVGARWRATTQLTLNGIRVRNVFEYQLEQKKGTTLEFEVRGTQTARRQTVEAGGATLRVKRFKTTFRGTTTTDLTRLLPVASRVRGSGDQAFDVKQGDDRGELRQHIELETTLEPQ